MNNPLLERVISNLLDCTYFSDFQFRKRDASLFKKTSYGYEMVELQHWESFDLSRDAQALTIKPLYLKRFNVLHSWFEKFSFKTITDQRDNYSVGFDGSQLGKTNQFFFLLSEQSFETDFELLEKELVENSQSVFSKFSQVSDLYEYCVEPILKGGVELPNVGADWVFEYLAITKIVKKDVLWEVKAILEKQVNKLNERGEPNIIEYYPKFDEIVDCLVNTELPAQK